MREQIVYIPSETVQTKTEVLVKTAVLVLSSEDVNATVPTMSDEDVERRAIEFASVPRYSSAPKLYLKKGYEAGFKAALRLIKLT